MNNSCKEGSWELHISLPSPSLNQYSYSHWRKQQNDKKKWWYLIRQSPGFHEIPKATGKRRIHIIRYGRTLDKDNLLGGAKRVITDNLRLHGLIVDDSPQWLEITAECVKNSRGKKPRTVILIEEIA